MAGGRYHWEEKMGGGKAWQYLRGRVNRVSSDLGTGCDHLRVRAHLRGAVLVPGKILPHFRAVYHIGANSYVLPQIWKDGDADGGGLRQRHVHHCAEPLQGDATRYGHADLGDVLHLRRVNQRRQECGVVLWLVALLGEFLFEIIEKGGFHLKLVTAVTMNILLGTDLRPSNPSPKGCWDHVYIRVLPLEKVLGGPG
jgi:hypothetical protein